MKRVVLVSDAQTSLGEELVRQYLTAGYAVAGARCLEATPEGLPAAADEDLLLIDWDRRSPISTRNVLLSALNRYDHIDEALVLAAPELERSLLQELSYETIERAVDTWIKGTLFLCKTVLEHFGRLSGGSLGLVRYGNQEPGGELPPLQGVLHGSFRALARSLFAGSGERNVRIRGFECSRAGAPEYAAYIVATMTGKGARLSGRWLRFSGRFRKTSRR
jgi:NAD(P)-dependent dehydrogenase (short-subunit alcohol dehydrogenase family)